MSRLFVDTSALVALLDADDPMQQKVAQTFATHRDDELLTHGYVVAEAMGVVRRRFGVEGVRVLIDDVLQALQLQEVPTELLDEALRTYRDALPSSVSFVDRISLTVIDREGIAAVIALDPDLAAPGVTLLPSLGRRPAARG